MKHIIATIFTAAALAVAAETSITILGQHAKSEYVLPGSVYYTDGVGSTNGIIYVVIER